MLNDISLEVAAIALTYIDAHNRDTWLKVGNALKTEFGSSGFDVFDNWSQTADNYDAKAVKSVWRSLTVGKVNIGTVIYLAKQNGFDISKHEVKPIDPQEQAARQAKHEQQAREAEAHEKAEKAAFEMLIKNIIQASNDALSTPYTDSKGITTTGLLSINSNELHAFKHPFNQYNGKPESIGYALQGLITLVPFCDLKTGEFVRLQGISGVKATEGKDKGRYIKRWIGKGDGYYWCGDILNQGKPKVITEGMSDAQTIHEYTNDNLPTLAAGNDGSLKKAALALRAECPHHPIIVFGDNDVHGGGQAKAKAAATAINAIFMLPPSKYKDVNEWVLAEGAESLNKMIDEAIQTKKAVPPSEDGSTAPLESDLATDSVDHGINNSEHQAKEDTRKGTYFFLNEEHPVTEKRGVYFVGMSKEGKYLPPMQVCGVLKIKAITRNQDHQEHGFLLEWLDRDNHKHYWSMPAELFKGDGADYRGQLLSCGLYIAPTASARMRLAEYIQNHHTPSRALCVDKTGWYQQLFITPHRTYGKQPDNEMVIYQSSQSFVSGYRQHGSLEDWREKVAALCVGNSRLVFSICVAFAGALLRLAHEESGGFHLRGNSSVGKSTGQHLACSVWGSRDYKQTWRATINGLEGIAALYNDGLLVLDEMAQADPKAIGETVYMLGNEQGKIRSQKSLIPRKNLTWKLLFLSSGELSLEQMMRDGGKKTKAGQEVRLVDIAADAGKRMGMVEQLNDFATAKEFMDTLNRRTSQYYGTAGHAFLEAITQQPDEIGQFLKEFKQRFIKTNVVQGASEQVSRVASRFALVAAAGEMATDFGITGWKKGEAYQAAIACFNAWLDGRGGIGNQEVRAIKSQVRAFFEAHGESRFADWDDNPINPRTVINRAGFRKKQPDGDVFAVLPEAYSHEVCAGFDVKTVNKVLIEAGWITPEKDGKAAQRPTLPSIGRTRAYIFTPLLWQEDN